VSVVADLAPGGRVVTAHLTVAQARALGLDVPAPRSRPTRRALPGHGRSRCFVCGEVFSTIAAEDRHVVETSHARYECVLEVSP